MASLCNITPSALGMYSLRSALPGVSATSAFTSRHNAPPPFIRASGFLGVLDLLKVAQHGAGQNIYLIRFHYIPPRRHGA